MVGVEAAQTKGGQRRAPLSVQKAGRQAERATQRVPGAS